MTRQRFIAIGDIHFPYQNDNALHHVLSFIEKFKPRFIFLLGDIIDCYSLSRFDKDPSRILSLQKEFDLANSFIRKLKEICPYAKIVYIEGNHERRFQKYLNNHPEISSLRSLTVPTMLGLDALGIGYKKEYYFGDIVLTHGEIVRKYSGQSARAEMDRNDLSGISGHTHRLSLVYRTTPHRIIQWAEAGCLCGLCPDYIEGVPDWQNGFIFGENINGNVEIILKRI